MFGFKPSVPDISNESKVIDWFMKYDDKIKDFKNYYSLSEVEEFKGFVLKDINSNDSAQKLTDLIKLFEKQHAEILPKAASSYKIKQNLNRQLTKDEEVVYSDLIRAESFLAAKLRILGYFLLKKYGVNPDADLVEGSVVSSKENIFAQDLGLRMVEVFFMYASMINLNLNKLLLKEINKENEFLALLAMADYDLQEAMFLFEPKNLFTKEIQYKILDFFKPTSILTQKYFKCGIDDINKYMHLCALIEEKMFEARETYLHSVNPPHWYVAMEIVKYVKSEEVLNDPHDLLIPVIKEYMDKETRFYKNYLATISQKYNVVLE